MLAKPITYTDYNGVERTETFYFNLSQAELIDMQLGGKDGLYSNKLQKMIDNHDAAAIVGTIKEFVLKSYGEKTDDGKISYANDFFGKADDGKRFIKSPEITEAFMQTEAYSQLITELLSDDAKSSEFILGIMPQALREAAVAEMNKNKQLPSAN